MTMRFFNCRLPIVTACRTGLLVRLDMVDLLVGWGWIVGTAWRASVDGLGPDGLGVGEFAQAEVRQFASIAAFLDAAGMRGFEAEKPLINTPPVSRRRAMRRARPISLVHRLPPRP